MADTSVTLTPAQVQAIIDLCDAIKKSPDDNASATDNTRTLASQIEGFAFAARHTSEAEEATMMARRVMFQNATYAENKIGEATTIINKAARALAKGQDALRKAKKDMGAYYMLKDHSVGVANITARKASLRAGLAILELDYFSLET